MHDYPCMQQLLSQAARAATAALSPLGNDWLTHIVLSFSSYSLKVEAVFNSRLPRPKTSITLIAPVTIHRLHQIAGSCTSFGSVMSLAMHAPVLHNDSNAAVAIAKVTAAVQEVFERWVTGDVCRIMLACSLLIAGYQHAC